MVASLRPTLLALLLLLPLLAACSRPTPGLPRVWPGQSLSPNVQARSGDTVTLTLLATNESRNRDHGAAGQVRTYTAYPEGATPLDFTSSDVGRLSADDRDRAWVEEIDTKNRVLIVSFGQLGAQERKTATITFRVAAPPGASLAFRTMLTWANASPDGLDCDATCVAEQLQEVQDRDPQVAAYVADHEAEVRALIRTYPGGGDALANTLDLPVGDTALNSPTPRVALLLGDREQHGRRMTASALFTPGEPVMLWYNLPDQAAIFLVRTDAFEDGRLDWTLDDAAWDAIPPEATSIVARGQYSNVEALHLFNRSGREPLPAAAAATLP